MVVIKLLHSGLYVYNLYPVNRYDWARQYELQVDVGQLTDDSGSVQTKTIVAPFQRLSSKQSRRDLLSAELNNHAARNPAPTFAYPEWDRLYDTMKYSNHGCTT